MTKEARVRDNMFNPGDLRLPEGYRPPKIHRVLILPDNWTGLVRRSDFDLIVPLKGTSVSPEAEQKALDATTYNSQRETSL